jgi:hypothetical protein
MCRASAVWINKLNSAVREARKDELNKIIKLLESSGSGFRRMEEKGLPVYDKVIDYLKLISTF